jgi:hypothetical protein
MSARSSFSFVCSVRTPDWRLTEWYRWNKTSWCPEWGSIVVRELYDHRNDTAPYNVDDFEFENVVDRLDVNATVVQLQKVLRENFGEGCPA